jgi:hypothetical protein
VRHEEPKHRNVSTPISPLVGCNRLGGIRGDWGREGFLYARTPRITLQHEENVSFQFFSLRQYASIQLFSDAGVMKIPRSGGIMRR